MSQYLLFIRNNVGEETMLVSREQTFYYTQETMTLRKFYTEIKLNRSCAQL